MRLSYIPVLWRKSCTVFIPKPRKDDYAEPKSYRPISQTSFFFKMLELLVYWFLDEGVLWEHPLSDKQHVFRKGLSTEVALSKTINFLEQRVYKNRSALAVFLDIEGAFDNLNTNAAITGMERNHIPPMVTAWYSTYLRSRTLVAVYGGKQMERQLTS